MTGGCMIYKVRHKSEPRRPTVSQQTVLKCVPIKACFVRFGCDTQHDTRVEHFGLLLNILCIRQSATPVI